MDNIIEKMETLPTREASRRGLIVGQRWCCFDENTRHRTKSKARHAKRKTLRTHRTGR